MSRIKEHPDHLRFCCISVTCSCLVVFIALAMMSVSAHAADASADSAVKAQLVERTQKLLDAIAPGEKAPWAKAMAEECLYSDENGTTMTKAKFLEELGPLP